jgi:Rrf2 family protein
MLSNSTKYAIKAVLFLAINTSEDKKVMVKDISEPINVPQAYVAKLLQELSRKNIISSTRGSRGGFYLSHENKQHTVMDIIRALDSEKGIDSCLLSLQNCNENKPCPMHAVMDPFRSFLTAKLNEKTIDALAAGIRSGESHLPL